MSYDDIAFSDEDRTDCPTCGTEVPVTLQPEVQRYWRCRYVPEQDHYVRDAEPLTVTVLYRYIGKYRAVRQPEDPLTGCQIVEHILGYDVILVQLGEGPRMLMGVERVEKGWDRGSPKCSFSLRGPLYGTLVGPDGREEKSASRHDA